MYESPSLLLTQGSGEALRLEYQLEFRVSHEFKYEGARNKLFNLRLDQPNGARVSLYTPDDIAGVEYPTGFEESSGSKLNNMLGIGSSIDVDSRVTVGCIGALISYVQRRRSAAGVAGNETEQAIFRISSIAMTSLQGFM